MKALLALVLLLLLPLAFADISTAIKQPYDASGCTDDPSPDIAPGTYHDKTGTTITTGKKQSINVDHSCKRQMPPGILDIQIKPTPP